MAWNRTPYTTPRKKIWISSQTGWSYQCLLFKGKVLLLWLLFVIHQKEINFFTFVFVHVYVLKQQQIFFRWLISVHFPYFPKQIINFHSISTNNKLLRKQTVRRAWMNIEQEYYLKRCNWYLIFYICTSDPWTKRYKKINVKNVNLVNKEWSKKKIE